jgi:hypothetical protein
VLRGRARHRHPDPARLIAFIRLAVAAALLCVAAVLVVGCGEDEDRGSGDSDPGRLTKEEFLREGNGICARTKADLEAEAVNLGLFASEEDIETFAADTVIPMIEDQIAELRDLRPPRGDEQTVREIVVLAQMALADLEKDPAAVTDAETIFEDAGRRARAYGLTECEL